MQSTQMIEEVDESFVKTAANIMKYYVDVEERKQMLKTLRDILKENCTESEKIKVANKTKEEMEEIYNQNSKTNMKDIMTEYKNTMDEIRIDLSQNKRLLRYDKQIEELLQQVNEATPNDEVANDVDTELRLTGTDVNIIDPISKTRMTDPVKNTVCGHVYDRESLIMMLKKNKKTRCPVVGCISTEYINLNLCHTDIVTKMYLEKNP